MATDEKRQIAVLRDLAKEYMDLAAKPVQEKRRRLWRAHFGLKNTRVPVLVTFWMGHFWCRQAFSDDRMQCTDPFYRDYERWLRMQIFHDTIGDDYVLEPWITVVATHRQKMGFYGECWEAEPDRMVTGTDGGSWKDRPFISDWDDVAKLVPPHHEIDEEATACNVQRLTDAIGDIITVDVDRGPVLSSYAGDISTTLGALRGLDQVMLDMYDASEQLHKLLAFLRDGILTNQQEAEDAGDYSLTSQFNGAQPYTEELEGPRANSGPRSRKDLWGFFDAQEYILVSPRFHQEFMLQYQMPIMEHFGLVHYGCCDDLGLKIDMLRQVDNLRSVVAGPTADVARIAEQVGRDYVVAWRPSPAETISTTSWDEDCLRSFFRRGLGACRGSNVHVHMESAETLQGDIDRLRRWTSVVQEVAEAL